MLKPVTILNRPGPALQHLLNKKADPFLVKRRSYVQLVTRHGVGSDQAKKLLGIPDSAA